MALNGQRILADQIVGTIAHTGQRQIGHPACATRRMQFANPDDTFVGNHLHIHKAVDVQGFHVDDFHTSLTGCE